ncbi:sec-independent protein translocase protein TatB [Polynucleobacter sp. SHI8]|uniref:Sec-independent protein translocase protein TatB n=1 Tax=unclassified Polynucleobacter TaxID=2640945 RepID=UPI0024928AC3|nr:MULTISPECIES: Sec-independent protein translocase protein TatB [unclassified Polynucleobacter]BDW10042.1 sec-independent protein translocase protein TatB [Polynucleobacter sp. SHI2]BDW12488.1 sec-independent protein translocase protein TatB [Polynucleobacter sp. SHI8]
MFDIGLSKIALISVVALVVLGPERLPRVARTAGNLFGRAQRYMSEVKQEVSRQMEQEELKKMKDAATEAFNSARNDFKDLDQVISSQVAEVNSTMNEISSSVTMNTDSTWSENDNRIYTPRIDTFEAGQRQGRKSWRNKKGAVPMWFKHSNGIKVRVQSGAARVKRFRRVASNSTSAKSFFG